MTQLTSTQLTKAITADAASTKEWSARSKAKSVNDIMNQANRLMSAAGHNFNRVDLIRSTAFRYYDNIRERAGKFNCNDDAEYNKPYTRAQYMNA